MIGRVVVLAGAVSGGIATSQFPEFSQQYVQRLGGAVDALAQVVGDFDASAAAEGLSRDAALEQMIGSDFVERRQADMRATIGRYEDLSADLLALRAAGPVQRVLQPQRFADTEIARAAWADFKPAVPVTLVGLGFALSGALAGWAVLAGLMAGLRGLFFRRRRAI